MYNQGYWLDTSKKCKKWRQNKSPNNYGEVVRRLEILLSTERIGKM
jgi:hypothetical protein